ncbi:hypothetical protein JCM6882_003978 [Rhodosporidiobolus microsporus]
MPLSGQLTFTSPVLPPSYIALLAALTAANVDFWPREFEELYRLFSGWDDALRVWWKAEEPGGRAWAEDGETVRPEWQWFLYEFALLPRQRARYIEFRDPALKSGRSLRTSYEIDIDTLPPVRSTSPRFPCPSDARDRAQASPIDWFNGSLDIDPLAALSLSDLTSRALQPSSVRSPATPSARVSKPPSGCPSPAPAPVQQKPVLPPTSLPFTLFTFETPILPRQYTALLWALGQSDICFYAREMEELFQAHRDEFTFATRAFHDAAQPGGEAHRAGTDLMRKSWIWFMFEFCLLPIQRARYRRSLPNPPPHTTPFALDSLPSIYASSPTFPCPTSGQPYYLSPGELLASESLPSMYLLPKPFHPFPYRNPPKETSRQSHSSPASSATRTSALAAHKTLASQPSESQTTRRPRKDGFRSPKALGNPPRPRLLRKKHDKENDAGGALHGGGERKDGERRGFGIDEGISSAVWRMEGEGVARKRVGLIR